MNVDPICYQFNFSCITEDDHATVLSQVFETAVRDLMPYILDYTKDGFLKDYRYDTGDCNQNPDLIRWIGPILQPEGKTESTMEWLLQGLHDRELCGFSIGAGDIKRELQRYPYKSTPFSRFYNKWFGAHRQPAFTHDEFRDSILLVSDTLNCPTDDLSNISVPIFSLRDRTPFNVALTRIPVSTPSQLPPHVRYEIVAPVDTSRDDLYLFNMYIVMPRFLIGSGDEAAHLQQTWKEALTILGNEYPICFGVLSMDCPPHSWLDRGLTCYDKAYPVRKRFFMDYIPGYSWGTLINRNQAQLIGSNADGSGVFHECKRLDNGNVYYQLTPDWRIVSRDAAIAARRFFKPYLPNIDLKVKHDYIPESLRLGFTPDEIEYCWDKTDMCFFCIK
ncbi:MAG: hypothetical protein IKS31_08375 [Clostridia bacterium]|nr:hypothetical protein [Clostridia bacterium]